MPKRIQRKRTKGWRMPPNTVSVTRPSRWGNPFSVGQGRTEEQAVREFRDWVEHYRDVVKEDLAGKNLACWCALDRPCHADVLLELANQEGHQTC